MANPLRDPQDRRLPADRRAVRPGAVRGHRRPVPQEGDAGDLRPGQPRAAAAGLRLVGFARRDWADEDFAQIVHDAVKEHARTEFREEVWKQLAEGFRFVPGRLRRRRGVRHAAPHHRGARRGPRHRRQPRVLPRRSRRGFFGASSGSCKEHGLAQPARRLAGGGSWSRSRSGTTWSPPASSTRRRRRVPARLGLPDRPLPRQGDRPEHPGDALRQRRCSSRSGTPTTSTTCRSRWPRTSASAAGPATTTASAPPAT